jgi:hypothetical protein
MSNGVILSFFRRPAQSSDWSQQELAEFYRVESALLQGGLSVSTDRGVSDEGDPWFVFCRADNEEVIAHFARIAYEYVVASSFHAYPVRGRDFRKLIRDMLDRHPMMLPVKRNSGQKVFLHPSSVLLALLASAYFLSSDKELIGGHGSTTSESRGVFSFLREKLSIVAALALAVTWLENHAELATKFLDGLPLFHSSNAKLVHVAGASHDASLDFLQLAKSLDVEKHASLLPHQDSNSSTSQNGEGSQGHNLPVHDANVVAHGSAPSVDAAFATLANSPANGYQAGLGGSDNAATAGMPSLVMNAAISSLTAEHVSSGAWPSTSLGIDSSGEVNSVVLPSDEAVQIAQITTGNSSAQTFVLSSNPTSVDVALQQAFQQIGFGTDLLQKASLSATESAVSPSTPSSVNTHDSAAVSPNTTSSDSSLATSSAPLQASTYDNQVEQTVAAFLAHTPNFEIAISGANVIFIDPSVADARSPEFGIQIFDMSDGSTLSLVGIVQHSALAALTA